MKLGTRREIDKVFVFVPIFVRVKVINIQKDSHMLIILQQQRLDC